MSSVNEARSREFKFEFSKSIGAVTLNGVAGENPNLLQLHEKITLKKVKISWNYKHSGDRTWHFYCILPFVPFHFLPNICKHLSHSQDHGLVR